MGANTVDRIPNRRTERLREGGTREEAGETISRKYMVVLLPRLKTILKCDATGEWLGNHPLGINRF